MSPTFFIGWDVGGWNCDKNRRSRDAIVILDKDRTIVGRPWRGNLRENINNATTTIEWIASLFRLCGRDVPEPDPVVLAIDTPLGFSTEFVALASGLRASYPLNDRYSNQYLYRHTERLLFKEGDSPLSAIKDMIGSQSTKGMHVLAKFAPLVQSCGVWTDGKNLHVIETYPAACRRTALFEAILPHFQPLGHSDFDDARICALVAYLFATSRETFTEPPVDVPTREGWIWIPKGAEA